MNVLSRGLRVLVASALLVGAASCAHAPSPEQRKMAAGRYEAAVALVHEAGKAAVEGDRTTQDLKYREALRELLEAVKGDPANSDVRYLLGVVYFTGFGRHAEAEEHLKAAIRLRADKGEEYPQAENLLGVVLVDAGRAREAIPHFEKARTNLLYDTPYFAEQELGWAYFKLGQLDDARAHLSRAVVAYPDLCGAYVKLAEVEEARGDEAKVQKALLDFVERCDSDRLRAQVGAKLLSWAYFRLGMSRIKTGERELAAEALRQCTSRFPREAVYEECDKSLRALEQGGGSAPL